MADRQRVGIELATGIVHQNIGQPVLDLQPIQEQADLGLLADVQGLGAGDDTGLAEIGRRACQAIGVARGNDDPGAQYAQLPRDGQTDARAAAGHEGRASGEQAGSEDRGRGVADGDGHEGRAWKPTRNRLRAPAHRAGKRFLAGLVQTVEGSTPGATGCLPRIGHN